MRRIFRRLRHDQKCKKKKLSPDMQLTQKLRDDHKRMKKAFEDVSGRNIATNPHVTPSWREIVSLTILVKLEIKIIEDFLKAETRGATREGIITTHWRLYRETKTCIKYKV
ncbi:hypothetical protein Tco_0751807 [Tanacetum coccineum]|uniref:Uncharacterized protein n=1 Tax=Tanacetum coccineum TaxID=301880 RepID=A0ABQ4Z6B0_9ASTR